MGIIRTVLRPYSLTSLRDSRAQKNPSKKVLANHYKSFSLAHALLQELHVSNYSLSPGACGFPSFSLRPPKLEADCRTGCPIFDRIIVLRVQCAAHPSEVFLTLQP